MQRTRSQVSFMLFILSVESLAVIVLVYYTLTCLVLYTLARLCIAITNFDSNCTCFTFTFRAGLRWFIALCK